MTFGKLFMVSTRLIALPSELLIAVNALLEIEATRPATAPALALRPSLKLVPVCAPAFEPMALAPEKAPFNCSVIDPVRLSNLGVSSTEPRATSAI